MAEALQQRSLGKYELVVSLDRGGMANIYLALVAGPARFNKLLVLKILREDAATRDGDGDGVRMFLDEARLSARLVHPNIVHTYEVGECEGHYFLAMEYLDGQPYRAFQHRARAAGGIPIQEELRILSETARGLHHAHQLRDYHGEALHVVHRDVSPQNVFLTYDGQVKLIDFGIAKTSDSEHMTRAGLIKGKLEYIAPEQIRGEPIDHRADIFSLGVMLWEVVTGKRFAGGPQVGDLAKVQTRIAGGEPNVRSVQPEVPETLALIIDRATALRPDERWPDAASFADAIDDYLASVALKPSAKSLATFIAPLFAEQRQKTSKLIEQQVERVKGRTPVTFGENTGSLLRLKLADDTTSGLYLGGATPASSGEHLRILAPPEAPVANQAKLRKWAVVIGGAALFAAGASWLVEARPRAREQRVENSSAAPSAALPGTQVRPVTATAQSPASVRPEPIPRPAPAVSSSPPDGVPALPALVTLELRVRPEGARTTLDGAPLATPFSGRFRKDAALHHLEVSADGYRGQQQLISLDHDRALEVNLERAREREPGLPVAHVRAADETEPEPREEPPRADQAPPASVAPPARPGDDLRRELRPRVSRRHIDSFNPYARPN